MKNNKSVNQLYELLNEINNKLPKEDINRIVEFLENNEFGLAFETFCTQLYEFNIPISSTFYEKISFYGQSIEIHPSIWVPLKELIQT